MTIISCPTLYFIDKYHELFQPVVTLISVFIGTFLTFFVTDRYNTLKTRLEITKTYIDKYWNLLGYVEDKKPMKTSKVDKDERINEHNALEFLGMIAEQLYYIKRGLIIKEFAREWLYGMIDYMPIFIRYNHEGKDDIIKPVNALALENYQKNTKTDLVKYHDYLIKNSELVLFYPRILEIFTLKESFDLSFKKEYPKISLEDFFEKIYPLNFTTAEIAEKNKCKQMILNQLITNIKQCDI